jgi:hypothetical protein
MRQRSVPVKTEVSSHARGSLAGLRFCWSGCARSAKESVKKPRIAQSVTGFSRTHGERRHEHRVGQTPVRPSGKARLRLVPFAPAAINGLSRRPASDVSPDTGASNDTDRAYRDRRDERLRARFSATVDAAGLLGNRCRRRRVLPRRASCLQHRCPQPLYTDRLVR